MAAALRRLRGTEVERVRPEPEPPPPPWGTAPFRCAQHRGSAQRAAQGGSQEQPPYPGYAPQYWNSSPRASYPNPYPVGPELQGQGIDSSYTNGVYGPSYPAPGTRPPYPTLPQSNTYYSSEHPPATYSTESSSIYRTPSPASNWNYPPPDCPAEGSMVRRQVAGYSPPQAPGFPLPPYPYGDCNHSIPQQRPPPPQPGLQEAAWQTPGVYGMQTPYGWPPAPAGHGNQYIAESWSGSGASAPLPPNNHPKDSYSQMDQGINQHGYLPEANNLPSGTMNDYKPAQLDTKPSASNPKVQYSAQPQLYDNVHKKPSVIDNSVIDNGSASKINVQPPTNVQPGIQKIAQVMEGIEQLEEEVDEFVGKKTDKDYWLLEEMLTKKLLELDSVETGGQDHVRQARKEAVHRIQATLEELERKGL
ncbi:BAG family molecular chaperone regulator 4 isoform X1 [Python bivittatus]|uniref:BAG family molecular chaperone regulator 4 isoform X1 n=1 Tax=Python bivittatus TaxID=176946 RepID=A0A9F2WG73_PYTBI|nr:BAG family molecular chaperone regulator 4 isoform X1 [Python bivittatus]